MANNNFSHNLNAQKGANKMKAKFVVTYIGDDGVAKAKEFGDPETANAAYEKIGCFNSSFPRKLENIIGKVAVLLRCAKWGAEQRKTVADSEWKSSAETRLKNAGIKRPQIDALLSINVIDLQNAIISKNIDKLTSIKGVGSVSAKKAIFALKSICKATVVEKVEMVEFTRVQLNNATSGPEIIVDKIRKKISPIEDMAIAMGGNDAIIHVVSWIADPKKNDTDAIYRAELLGDYWRHACHNGLVIDGKKYVPFGHGTNAAKECKTLWVLETILDKMVEDLKIPSNWKITVAKQIAYMVGLQSVPTKPCRIPLLPQDFCVLPSVVSSTTVNIRKWFLDGHFEDIDNAQIEVNRSDGYFMIDIPDEMKPVLYNRMIARGDDPEEADRILHEFIENTKPNSYRAHPIALKGFGDKAIRVHEYLSDNGITTTSDGRPLDQICVFVDETVLKTTIGEGKAFRTFEDWCNTVGEIDLGVCVQGHKKSRKNVSYQVAQSLCDIGGQTVRDLVKPTIQTVNAMHTVNGISVALGQELGAVIRKFPEILNCRNVKEKAQRAIAKSVDDAFGGKLLKCCYYAFITPDPFYILQGWFGLERTGSLEAGEFHVGNVKKGTMVTWRSPVMHPNSVRIIENVAVKPEFAKYIKNDEFVIRMNSKDDISMAMDADWDGDHAFVSAEPAMIQAARETLAKWNRLIVWETPKTEKIVVKRSDEIEYYSNLTHRNELGLTVYGLNALLNGVHVYNDQTTGKKTYKPESINHVGVDFKKFAANVLVDASKHGGATITEPKASANSKFMAQPWAKDYRDAALNKLDTAGKTKKQIDEKLLAKRAKLDAMCQYCELDREQMKIGTLNKMFTLFCRDIDRSLEIKDAPDKEFDFHEIMFNPEESYRGMQGLIRKGSMGKILVDGFWIRPDQGLFDSIARRIERDRKDWRDSDRKDKEDTSFEETWRINALAEIQAFAESFGKTLQDAYDVITWQMFKYIDKIYATMDGSGDYVRDNLWKAYWMIFGGMAAEAASHGEIIEEIEDESWFYDEDADYADVDDD